ncbi:MAG: 5'/3'-nucleotidase SurE [Rhodobacter sp.]|nr:5'/3'-nucleotidase SurE [Rhodobacter sp.]MCA3451221.1 5'/3'-nucleotidase SurE [Rhodobacter sp.]
MDLTGHRILLTNDDGIHASGLILLEKVIRQFTDQVWVVAPAEERSGAGHSISMHDPIRVRALDDHHFAVKGTPTDCALMGIYELMPQPPTLMLSGVNWGANLAEDITYSGTAAAAMEGALLGVPSIAFSQVHHMKEVHWATAEAFLPRVLDGILKTGFDPGTFVNVNFPAIPPDQVRGIRVTDQGMRPPGSFIPEGRVDARTKPYYWIRIAYKPGNDHEGTDLRAMTDREVSVTPIQLDMTARAMKDRLNRAFTG